MASIYITRADSTQQEFLLPEQEGVLATLGSNEDCTIPLPDIEGIAGLHCSIALVGGEYVITDDGGGIVEGERAVSSEALREGAAYGIGSAWLFFVPAVVGAAPEGEVLAEPIPVSEYAEAAPVQEAAPAEAAPAAPVKKKRKPSPLGKAPLKVPKLKKASETMTLVNWLYVLVVLAIAFYGGMALRHWMETGNYLPKDEVPAKAVKK